MDSSKSGSFFQQGGVRWHYHQYGNGPNALLCFHGYGQTGQMFEPVVPALKEEYTIYAFNFIHHGRTEWNSRSACTPADWVAFIEAFARENNYKSISMMGFSMGGRMILHSLPLFKIKIDRLFLIAMDGVKLNKINHPVLNRPRLKKLARKLIYNSAWVLKFLPVLQKTGWLSQQQVDFMHYYLANKKRRKRAYMVWKSMLNFLQPLEKITDYILKNNIQTHILFGKEDRILPPHLAQQLHDLLPGSTLHWIDGGHFIVDERLNPIIRNILAKA